MANELSIQDVKSILTHKDTKSKFMAVASVDEKKVEREIAFAMQHVLANPFLLKCSKASFQSVIVSIATTGLSLNPVSKQAYIVPRFNRSSNSLEACLDPSYVGLAKLLTDTGTVKHMECQLVYENDDIQFDYASTQKVISHVPYFLTGKEKGNIVFVYSIATLNDGSKHVEAMPISEINEIKESSESYVSYVKGKTTSCIWIKHFGEMCRKTVIKRHYKHLPKSKEHEKIENAIELDYDVNGINKPPSIGQVSFAESLILNSVHDDDMKDILLEKLSSIESERELLTMISQVENNQLPTLDQDIKHRIEASNT